MTGIGSHNPMSTEGAYVQAGEAKIFEDYTDEGPMWDGHGDRHVSYPIRFEKPYIAAPVVFLSVSLIDVRTDYMIRYALRPENINELGFDIYFETWGDSRFARVSVSWMSIGQSIRDEYWVDF